MFRAGRRGSSPRLRYRAGMVEKKDGNLFVVFLTDVNGPVHVVAWLIPIHLARRNLDRLALATIPKLDGESVAMQHNGYPMVWVSVPWHGLARSQAQTAHDYSVTADDFFLDHRLAARA
jgi:hypothetical protein